MLRADASSQLADLQLAGMPISWFRGADDDALDDMTPRQWRPADATQSMAHVPLFDTAPSHRHSRRRRRPSGRWARRRSSGLRKGAERCRRVKLPEATESSYYDGRASGRKAGRAREAPRAAARIKSRTAPLTSSLLKSQPGLLARRAARISAMSSASLSPPSLTSLTTPPLVGQSPRF